MLASFGGELPYEDVVLLAAYPLEALNTNLDFVIFRGPTADRAGTPTEIRVGRIRPSDLAAWR